MDLEAGGASVEGACRVSAGAVSCPSIEAKAGISPDCRGYQRLGVGAVCRAVRPVSIWPVVLINCASALLLLVAGLQSAWAGADWRAQALKRRTWLLEEGRTRWLAGAPGRSRFSEGCWPNRCAGVVARRLVVVRAGQRHYRVLEPGLCRRRQSAKAASIGRAGAALAC